MNLIWRTLLHFFLSRRRSPLGPFDVSSTAFRVLPTDLDTNRHMNNGRYLSISDLGRLDLLRRTGVYATLMRNEWYPVVQSSSMTHRKSLMPWQKFEVESKVSGFDDRAVYMEQRFVVKGEIYASIVLKARFLKRTGGTVPMNELVAALGFDAPHTEPAGWVQRWAQDAALPSTRQPAPSEW
ncbi:acyl-CoA thioesterase [Homoserinimonas hongtaonis]|uniref:4-hydroxybenzoyl-CoA thioesterase n=1 Tax=Homoserinimonas hongtaonis TaxID=2079791 RepID=A0A2U1T257_9MICO|nr:acyl-CoA thioesterase [Salinibacterium hongtaonis]PWB97930.1 4-hydroxybenzoyl-CoA thioesterase [Salinibacterium hongtaonis]